MIRYNNCKKFLKNNLYELETSLEIFLETQEITFNCTNNHKTTMKITSFINKKSKLKDCFKYLCTECKKNEDNLTRFNEIYIQVLQNNHKLLEIYEYETGKCKYICGNCNSIRESTYKNLIKKDSTIFCGKCMNIKNRTSIEDINVFLSNLNYKCIEYTNNKNLIVICDKQHKIDTLSVFDYKRGRRCPICAPERRGNTNIEKYGCVNVMHNENIVTKLMNKLYTTKDYSFPSGNIVKVQGYEPYCIDDLLKVYKENNIVTECSLMPAFYYFFNNTNHRYYPDILLKDDNKNIIKIIEVKSLYTYTLDYRKNIAKWISVSKSDFIIEVWIYDEKRNYEIKEFKYIPINI